MLLELKDLSNSSLEKAALDAEIAKSRAIIMRATTESGEASAAGADEVITVQIPGRDGYFKIKRQSVSTQKTE